MKSEVADAYRVKGGIFRSHVLYLKKHHKLEAVLARLSPKTAALVTTLPLASSWVEGPALDEIVEAVDALEGTAAVLEMEEAMLRLDVVPLVLPMLQGILRICGTSPATLLKRFGDITRTSVQGLDFRYEPTSERSGQMEVRYSTHKAMARCSFMTTVPALMAAVRICGIQGTVSDPVIHGPRSAVYRICW
jgi:hypothetical protein